MTDIILSEKHYSRKIVSDVINICDPLYQYGINYFCYSRFFKDGSMSTLVTNWESFQHHCNQRYPVTPPISEDMMGKKFHYFPFLNNNIQLKNNPVERDYRDLFNLGFPIFFVETYSNYVDLFIFSTTRDNIGIINFYFNNLEFLEKFKFYFKDKAHRLIKKYQNNKIILPKHMFLDLIQFKTPDVGFNKEDLIKKLATKRFILSGLEKDIPITKSELEVIKYLSTGHTIKEAAKAMEISPRTVETYLNNTKLKLGFKKKSEIIKLISEFSLL